MEDRVGLVSVSITPAEDEWCREHEVSRSAFAVTKRLGVGRAIGSRVTLPNGVTIKVRMGIEFALGGTDMDEFGARLGVLACQGERPVEILLLGVISRERFAEIADIVDHGQGGYLAVRAEDLRPFSVLDRWMWPATNPI
jgi:hypothetical protein